MPMWRLQNAFAGRCSGDSSNRIKVNNPTITRDDMRLSEQEYQSLIKGRPIKDAKPTKYRNKKVEVDGILFDSKKEAHRYHELKLMAKVGEIIDLQLQPKFPFDLNGVHICSYVGDFQYLVPDKTTSFNGIKGLSPLILHVEDVKSAVTRKLPAYRIKVKMMRAFHGIEVEEI